MEIFFVLLTLFLSGSSALQPSLTYDPSWYSEVYPDPTDPAVLRERTPLYFALILSLGGNYSQFESAGAVSGMRVALDDINNDSSILPGYTLHYTASHSKCNRTVSLEALFNSQILLEPKKLAIIGSGCSVATEPTAEVSHFYNITQMSCVSSSPELSNRVRFPKYFQLLSSADKIALGYYGVIKEYDWRRVALIVQDEKLFTESMARLKDLIDEDELVDYDEKVFDSDAGIDDLGPNPFDEDSRIFLLSMYSRHAIDVVCKAYEFEIYLPRYLLLTLGWYSDFWWREDTPECTVEQREKVLLNSLVVSDEIFLDEKRDYNMTTTPGITVGQFIMRERRLLQTPSLMDFSPSLYASYCHDAIWTLAYAINSTLNSLNDEMINQNVSQAFDVQEPFRLENITYSSSAVEDLIFQHLHSTNFTGLTGPLSFGVDGIRNIANLLIFQFRNETNGANTTLDRIKIGNVFPPKEGITYLPGESVETVWNGLIPYGGVPRMAIVTIHPAITSIYVILACASLVFAIACAVFNFVYREKKLIKMASSNLNYLIVVGAIILYLDTIFFVIPTTNPNAVAVLCNLTTWLTAIGYSLCYGTILVKLARIYHIFNKPTPDKKRIEDWKLMLMVASLVAIDLVILFIYTLVEGVRGGLTAKLVPHRESPTQVEGRLEIVTNNFIYICDSTIRDIFLGLLYGYKMLLQVLALFMALAIRKVKIKGLDSAKYIGAAVYVTSIVLAVIIVAVYTLKDSINGFAALFCTGFLIGTTVILGLVFGPLMFGLYKDPNGEDIFKKTTMATKDQARKSEGNFSDNDYEMQGLWKRIKELEDENKELRNEANTASSNLPTNNSGD